MTDSHKLHTAMVLLDDIYLHINCCYEKTGIDMHGKPCTYVAMAFSDMKDLEVLCARVRALQEGYVL